MFQHILVPLDGSSRAEQSLPVAARLAHSSGGTITLLSVVNLLHEALSYGIAGPCIPADTIESDLAGARTYLEQVAQRTDLAGVPIDKQTALGGDPAAVILSVAEEQPVDLIVLSSHGYTGVKRWMLGSVAEKVARYAPVPVLMLRDGVPLRTHLHADGTISLRALVPLDASARSQDSIPPAAELVAALSSPGHGQIHLTQILVLPEDASQAERARLLQGTRQNLEAIGQSIRDGLVANVGSELHLAFSWEISLDSDIAEGIVRIAENGEERADTGQVERCDLIAITTHGAGGSQRWATGSITERVVQATHLPLLIVRPADMLMRERQQRAHQVATAK